MTHVDKSPVTREVRGLGFGDIVVKITSEGLYLREKGKRKTYGPLSWDFVFRRAVDLDVQRNMEVKAPRRKRVTRNLLSGR